MPNQVTITKSELAALVSASAIGFSGLLFLPLWISGLSGPDGLGDAVAGRIASAQLFTVAAVIWLAALRIHRVDRRLLSAVGAVIVGLANLAASMEPPLTLMFVARIASGFGEGLLLAAMHAAVAGSVRPERVFAVSNFFVIMLAVICYSAITQEVALHGASAIFLVAAALALVGAPLIWWMPRAPKADPSVTPRAQGFGATATLGLVATACFYGAEGSLFAYIVQFGLVRGLPGDLVGRIISVGLLFGLIGPVLVGLLSGKVKMTLPFTASLIALAGVALLYAFGTAQTYALTTYAFNFVWIFAVTYSSGLMAALDANGRLVAITPAFRTLGYAIGPLTASFLVTNGSYELLGIVACIFYLLALAIFLPLSLGVDRQTYPQTTV